MLLLSRVAIAIVVFASLNASAFGQKVWHRPMTEWKADDCLKIVSNSPWAFSFSDINVQMWTQTMNEKALTGQLGPEIIMRLYSAETVRNALIRMNQVAAKYDKLDEKGKAAVDDHNKYLQNCDTCKDHYVVVLIQPGTSDAKRNLVGERMGKLKLADLKGKVYLANDKGERRELIEFTPPKSEAGVAAFFFNRYDEAQKPLLTADSKKLKVVMRLGGVDERAGGLMQSTVDFDVSKMIINSKVDF